MRATPGPARGGAAACASIGPLPHYGSLSHTTGPPAAEGLRGRVAASLPTAGEGRQFEQRRAAIVFRARPVTAATRCVQVVGEMALPADRSAGFHAQHMIAAGARRCQSLPIPVRIPKRPHLVNDSSAEKTQKRADLSGRRAGFGRRLPKPAPPSKPPPEDQSYALNFATLGRRTAALLLGRIAPGGCQRGDAVMRETRSRRVVNSVAAQPHAFAQP
jgi:hypothetical protein